MLLLHQSVHAEGDYDWKTKSGVLSPQAEQAAHAVADFLVMTYKAHRQRQDADRLWEEYAARWFLPLGADVSGTVFYFPNTRDTIRFDYRKEYRKYGDAYGFDVFPQWGISVFGQSNPSNLNDFTAFGAEVNWHWIPGFADGAGALLNRIPYGATLSITRMPRWTQEQISHPVYQLQALFAPNLVIIPKINAHFQPRLGMGITSYAPTPKTSFVGGADLAWTLAKPQSLPFRRQVVSRLGIGYEFDAVGLPARHTLVAKIGLYYVRGRKLFRARE